MTTHREELDVRTPDGLAHAFVHHGDAGPRPGVVLYTDAYAVRPAMHAAAERIASLGHVVLLPDVFYRSAGYRAFDPVTAFSDPQERERVMALVGTLTPERMGADAGAYLDALASRADVRRDRLATMGYCMGGRFAFVSAAAHPERVRAVASFHGGGLVSDKPESPHRMAEHVKAAVYLGIADQDRSCTPEHQGALASALAAAGVRYCMELYAGKRHGFAVPDSAVHDAEAEARHWTRLETFLAESLA